MTRSNKAWLLVALAALLWAQAFGLVHRVAHASYSPGAPYAPYAPDAPDASHPSHALHAPDSSSDHEAGSPECRLIDQLLQAQALTSAKAPDVTVDIEEAAPRRAHPAPAGLARAHAWARGPPRA